MKDTIHKYKTCGDDNKKKKKKVYLVDSLQ